MSELDEVFEKICDVLEIEKLNIQMQRLNAGSMMQTIEFPRSVKGKDLQIKIKIMEPIEDLE